MSSECKKVEQALRESEQRLRQLTRLIEGSHTPIFMWNLDGTITDWNRGSEELYGYSRLEAVGRNVGTLLALQPGVFESTQSELLTDGSWSGERQQRAKDGRWLTVEAQLQLAAFDGVRMVLETNRDITNHKP